MPAQLAKAAQQEQHEALTAAVLERLPKLAQFAADEGDERLLSVIAQQVLLEALRLAVFKKHHVTEIFIMSSVASPRTRRPRTWTSWRGRSCGA